MVALLPTNRKLTVLRSFAKSRSANSSLAFVWLWHPPAPTWSQQDRALASWVPFLIHQILQPWLPRCYCWPLWLAPPPGIQYFKKQKQQPDLKDRSQPWKKQKRMRENWDPWQERSRNRSMIADLWDQEQPSLWASTSLSERNPVAGLC